MGEGGSGSTHLPPGFRFIPSDEELVAHFLYRKAALLPSHPDIIPTIDRHHYSDPWTLTGKALHGSNKCWYFFARRATGNGCWEADVGTDDDEVIAGGSGSRDVGVKKTLRYHVDGNATNWIMHVFHLLDGALLPGGGSSNCSSTHGRRKRRQPDINKWVICRMHESSAAAAGSPASLHDDGTELSCLDEVFLSLDDDCDDEVSLPY